MQEPIATFASKYTGVVIVAALGVVSMLPIILVGVPYGLQDQVHHLQIANAYFEAWTNGVLLPDWVFAENNGYGSVTVRFYPPLIHWTLAFFRMVFRDWQIAVFAAFALWAAIGNIGVWLWSLELKFGRLQAFFAALIFSLVPYHLNQFYNSFMYGEFVSLAVLPFCFLFVKRVCEKCDVRNMVLLGVSMALIVLANLPQLVIGLICIGFYTLFYLRRSHLAKQLFHLAMAGFLALACTAFYWVRVIYEMEWLKISQPNINPQYDYRNHFLFADFSFDGGGVWFAGLMTAFLLLIVIVALSVTENLRSSATDSKVRPLFFLSVFSILMMLPLARPIWDAAGFLQRVQFPWRFLSTLSLTASLLFGYCFIFFSRKNYEAKRPRVIVLAGLLAIFATFCVKQVMLGPPVLSNSGIQELVGRSRDQIGLDHWHLVWVDRRSFEESRKISTESRAVSLEVWEPERAVFDVESGQPEHARVALMFYPHWRATINGDDSSICSASDGSVSIALPPQKSQIHLTFTEPSYTSFSRWTSAFAIGLMVLLFLSTYVRRRKESYQYE